MGRIKQSIFHHKKLWKFNLYLRSCLILILLIGDVSSGSFWLQKRARLKAFNVNKIGLLEININIPQYVIKMILLFKKELCQTSKNMESYFSAILLHENKGKTKIIDSNDFFQILIVLTQSKEVSNFLG